MLGHLPRACPNYGWYYPAPGKTREDYTEDRQRVQDLIAADIIQEHEPLEDDVHLYVFESARPSRELKEKAFLRTCPTCQRGPGERCQTAGGRDTELHKSRLDAVDSPAPGS